MRKFVINDEFLQQLETLQTILKNNVAGMFGGNRRSRSIGSSSEFADYREYIPGDDITKIDWNVYARFERFYLKLYLDERQMHTRIYIDASASMDHGDGRKADQAVRLAAAFAYLSVCEMEKVSVYVIKDDGVHEIISSLVGKDAFVSSIGKLNNITFDSDSYISRAIVPSKVGFGDGMSIIISDFLTDNDYEMAVDHLISKNRDVFCVQVLSMAETNPQFIGKFHLFDVENIEKDYKKNIDRDIIAAYKMALEHVIERVRGLCESRGAGYMLASADEDINEIFFKKLTDMGVLK